VLRETERGAAKRPGSGRFGPAPTERLGSSLACLSSYGRFYGFSTAVDLPSTHAIIVDRSGIGGWSPPPRLAVKGARVLVLGAAYLIPGGSGRQFRARGLHLDVAASMIFGFG